MFLFEHDLRANASRLSRGKTGTTHRVVARGHAFRDHALTTPVLFWAPWAEFAARPSARPAWWTATGQGSTASGL